MLSAILLVRKRGEEVRKVSFSTLGDWDEEEENARRHLDCSCSRATGGWLLALTGRDIWSGEMDDANDVG